MICKKNDCFACPYPDCINDYVRPPYKPSEAQKKRNIELHKQRYSRRKEAGICVICGKRRPMENRLKCSFCTARLKEMSRRYRQRDGVTPRVLMDGVGLCTMCGKSPPIEGKRVCRTCYDKLVHNLENAKGKNYKYPGWTISSKV